MNLRLATVRARVVVVLCVVASGAILGWTALQAIGEWRRSTTLFADRRAQGAVDLIFAALVHDMRGEAGSFGYPLVTRVGASLCRYIDKIKPMDGKNLRVVRVHVDALRAMVRTNAKGKGPRIAQEIVKALETVVQIHPEQREQEQPDGAANDDGFKSGVFGR